MRLFNPIKPIIATTVFLSNLILSTIGSAAPVDANANVGANFNSDNKSYQAHYTEVYKNDDLGWEPFVFGSVNEAQSEFYAKLGMAQFGTGMHARLLANFGNEKVSDKYTDITETISDQRQVTESSTNDQITETNKQKIGCGIGNNRINAEAAFSTNNTTDKNDGTSKYIDTYNNGNNTIIVDNETTTDLNTKRNQNQVRVRFGGLENIIGALDYDLSCDVYGNWESASTTGRIVTNTTVNSDGDSTENYHISSIEDNASRQTYTFMPRIETKGNKANMYSALEMPVHLGACEGIGANGVINWNRDKLIYSGTLNSDFGEGVLSAEIGAGLAYSNNANNAFDMKRESLRGHSERALSPLCSEKEREIRDSNAYNNFASTLNGVGGGLTLKLGGGKEVGYGVSVIGSTDKCFGYVNASVQGKDYDVSVTGGSPEFNATVGYGKINGNDVYKGGITLNL